ncbi:phage portal protein [Niabella aurantiaca]|uniref:phage portal protein n=1 Tax=Niabella aurantiaca TaxID=379900 RepID=UPI000369571F|nr:phage portal protein [Niabella aurantiaca]
MQIEEILQEEDLNKRIQYLQSQRKTTDDKIEEAKKQLDPNLHAVTDLTKREKRKVTKVEGSETKVEYKEVNRTPFAYQSDIIDKRVSFMFGNPLLVSTNSTNANAKKVLEAIQKVNEDVKIDSRNREIARTKFSYYEVAEYWATSQADKQDRYGFESEIKFRLQVFKPDDGDRLYPFFDDLGDLVAFSRGYVITNVEGKEIEYFETWTKDSYARYFKSDTGWTQDVSPFVSLENSRVKELGLIPVVWGYQKHTEYYKVQRLCDRNDTLASNHGDINDRHSIPILKAKNATVTSKIDDFVQIEGPDADLDYIAWDNATQSVDSEFSRNESKIYSLTRTPMMSFDAMKGMGNILSGEGLKTALMDPHLEVFNKMEDFDVYFTRRYNIVKRILGVMNKAWSNSMNEIKVSVKVIPYMAGDDITKIQTLIELYQAGMISLETACKLNPWFEDALAEYNRIKKEKEAKDSDPAELDMQMNQDE